MFSQRAHGALLADVAVRRRADRAAVQAFLERRVVVDLRVDLERHAVAQMVHAARRNGEAERERLQNPRVVRIALHQSLHGHAVFQRLARVVPFSTARVPSARTLPKPSRAAVMNSSLSTSAGSPHASSTPCVRES